MLAFVCVMASVQRPIPDLVFVGRRTLWPRSGVTPRLRSAWRRIDSCLGCSWSRPGADGPAVASRSAHPRLRPGPAGSRPHPRRTTSIATVTSLIAAPGSALRIDQDRPTVFGLADSLTRRIAGLNAWPGGGRRQRGHTASAAPAIPPRRSRPWATAGQQPWRRAIVGFRPEVRLLPCFPRNRRKIVPSPIVLDCGHGPVFDRLRAIRGRSPRQFERPRAPPRSPTLLPKSLDGKEPSCSGREPRAGFSRLPSSG